MTKQAPNNSYGPPEFYEDISFVCVNCGRHEVWTAAQQQWWYEVAKGSIYARAIRCRACRKKRLTERDGGIHPEQPIRHTGTLIKLVRQELEPALLSAEFTLSERNRPRSHVERVWLDYTRGDEVLSLAYERPPRLVAEFLDFSGNVHVVAATEFFAPRTRGDVAEVVQKFATAVREFLASQFTS
ncbi:MAG: zinc-ribbon domain-containing protein [Planctomycetales bacterium]